MTTTARDFELDDFQVRAIEALDAGRSVLVAAPTGSGKTVVAEHAVARALAAGRRAFYTTPIKALSNQKYGDLARVHGAGRVGLLTGDTSINGDAPVVVMTTEVLRNMVYAGAPGLDRLDVVVLDEGALPASMCLPGPGLGGGDFIHLAPPHRPRLPARPRCPTPRSWPTGSPPCADPPKRSSRSGDR